MTLSVRGRRRRVLPVAGTAVVLVAALVTAPGASAQPSVPASVPRQWTSIRAGFAQTTMVDTGLHQVYVVGQGARHTGYVSVVAYSSTGRALWSATFADGAYDYAAAAVVDPVNHQLYVTGSTSLRDEGDVLTVAYAPDGRRLWERTWGGTAGSTGGSFDVGQAIAVDPGTHRLFVVGGGGGSRNGRLCTLAYEADGSLAWETTYTGNAKAAASGRAVAVDTVTHDVVVGGGSAQSPSTVLAPVTVGYDADGRRRWVDAYTAGYPAGGSISDVAVDPGTHAAYATGYSGDELVLLGYDAAGHRAWARGANATDSSGWYLLVDPETHQVFVSGQIAARRGPREYLTARYTPDGTAVWRRTYGPTGVTATDSYPNGMALDPTTHAVYVTGASAPAGQGYDIATIGYDQSGGRLFAARYGGAEDDIGEAVAVDPGRGVYVSGRIEQGGRNASVTIAY